MFERGLVEYSFMWMSDDVVELPLEMTEVSRPDEARSQQQKNAIEH